jgi:hypothetical protein
MWEAMVGWACSADGETINPVEKSVGKNVCLDDREGEEKITLI